MAIKHKDNKKITQTNEILKISQNNFKIHLNIQYPRQENALNSILETSSNVEVEQMTIASDEI